MTTPQAMWGNIQTQHQKARDNNKGNRTPVTILANNRTLNMLVMGVEGGDYLAFSKTVFHTAHGDVYFQPHKGMEDGEVVML